MLVKMINALTFIFLTPILVAAIRVPRSHSLVKGSARITVPRTLQERGSDLEARQGPCNVNCPNGGCCEGSCWCVFIFPLLCDGSYQVKVLLDVVLLDTTVI
jgi:hypothetical protein